VPDIRQLWDEFCALRFLIVGVWNTLFSYIVFAVLYHFFGGGWRDVPVQVISAVVGITNAYVCHRVVTFRSQGSWWQEYIRFYVVYGLQALLQMFAFFIFSTWLKYNGYIVQFVLTIVFSLASYWAHKTYSFRRVVCHG